MSALPRDPAFDSTRAFFAEGYQFVGNHAARLGSDTFRARLMGRPVVFMFGEEATRRFYDGVHFTRRGAMPQTTLRLLQDKGSVQTLDALAHRARKDLFLAMMSPRAITAMGDAFTNRWHRVIGRNRDAARSLHDLAGEALCAAACDWTGVPIEEHEVQRRATELLAMIDGAGSVGPRAWKALLLRRRAERWARDLVTQARRQPAKETPLSRLAHFRDPDGRLLAGPIAAVELLNLLRPTVAVARFVVFAALGLHLFPDWRARVTGRADAELFVQEVRRYFPFFPVIGGRVLSPFLFRGHDFAVGDWVLLGLHATNHDERLWPEPGRFAPDRFRGWRSSGYDLIPQGAGEYALDHRCPGEWNTVEILIRAVQTLAAARYQVPEQDLSIPLDRFPTLPRDGFVVSFA